MLRFSDNHGNDHEQWDRGGRRSVREGRPLQYFIHNDFDALRMELSGSLVGHAALNAYDAWRAEIFVAPRLPLVIDISYVTDTDEQGKAVLRAWHEHGARVVASSPPTRAIANPAHCVGLGAPAPANHAESSGKVFFQPTARSAARAESGRSVSALTNEKNAEKAAFLLHDGTEQPAR